MASRIASLPRRRAAAALAKFLGRVPSEIQFDEAGGRPGAFLAKVSEPCDFDFFLVDARGSVRRIDGDTWLTLGGVQDP